MYKCTIYHVVNVHVTVNYGIFDPLINVTMALTNEFMIQILNFPMCTFVNDSFIRFPTVRWRVANTEGTLGFWNAAGSW